MKSKISILLITLLLLSSCIVKSIQPFYTKTTILYNEQILGDFTDNDKGEWQIVSFKTTWERENNDPTKLVPEDLKTFERYQDGYIVKYIKKNNEALFIAMPFKVDDHIFLDFTPFEYEDDGLNPLVAQHLLKTHSVSKVDINSDGSLKLSWLSEDAVGPLFTENKIRLKHERIGLDEDLILTASSEELHDFLRKFVRSNIENKWDKDDIFQLTPKDAKP
ncbi:hypothetical protein SAMN04515667_1663 [Formosa sp. Hel1_31_208]|uniref:hypothetical protein n=1 Tax=Formosa sp. Hel1_31_208 TaxID=1798225 RepID=UPI00087B549D|nr:hypothetical protein [Formosa sp. Hel1_31_208]SDS21184.1 hypothetical protein SAMN04515667_1663 [Formosa sp. Hel1_31_208]